MNTKQQVQAVNHLRNLIGMNVIEAQKMVARYSSLHDIKVYILAILSHRTIEASKIGD